MSDSQPFSDRVSRFDDRLADRAEHDSRDLALETLASRPGERALEIGSGTGPALARLAREAGPHGAAVGVDRSWGMIEVARVLHPGGRLVVVPLAEPETPRAGVELYRWLHPHFPHFIDCRPIAPERVLVAPGFDVAAGSSP